MAYIDLTRGAVSLVDDADYGWLSKRKWYLQGTYAASKRAGSRVYMHRLILECPTGLEVDHINGDPLDNRRANLRLSTHAQNAKNIPKYKVGASSPYKGVYVWGDRIMACIKADGKSRYLGTFATHREAALAYNRAAIELHGQFARTNDIF